MTRVNSVAKAVPLNGNLIMEYHSLISLVVSIASARSKSPKFTTVQSLFTHTILIHSKAAVEKYP